MKTNDLDFAANPALLGVLADAPGMAFFSVDAGGRFVSWSRGAEELTGYSRQEVRGKNCSFFDGPECKGFEGLAHLVRTAGPDEHGFEARECRIRTRTNEERHLLGTARLVRDAEGKVAGAIACFVDLGPALRANAPAEIVEAPAGIGALIGISPPMIEVFERVEQAAASHATILLTGESGTGKEVAARAIHEASSRRDHPFVAVNCSAIPEALLESELFGHVAGAFTGAVADRTGLFASAEKGTLFLDEIGELSPLLQVKLLRVLQEREVVPVGSNRSQPVDVRLISATHRDLRKRLAEERIREDFFYRICVFEIRMPPLRDRSSDIPLLARHFAEDIARDYGRGVAGIASDAMEALVRHPWPGNVRELRNAIEHAMVVLRGDTISLFDLPEALRSRSSERLVDEVGGALNATQVAERLRILEALDRNEWNRTRTAEELGISRVTLWKKIRRYRIDEGIFKRGSRR